MASTTGTVMGLLPPSLVATAVVITSIEEEKQQNNSKKRLSLASRRKEMQKRTEAIMAKSYCNFGKSNNDSSVDKELLNMLVFNTCTKSARKGNDDNKQQKHEQQGQQGQQHVPRR